MQSQAFFRRQYLEWNEKKKKERKGSEICNHFEERAGGF